jgi:hypothetical protein
VPFILHLADSTVKCHKAKYCRKNTGDYIMTCTLLRATSSSEVNKIF